MRRRIVFGLVGGLVLFALSSLTLAQKESPTGIPQIAVELTGALEVPGPGDSDGRGKALLTLDHAKGQLCYEISVENIQQATIADLHIGGPGQAGEVKATFEAPAIGSSKGCLAVGQVLIHDILQNPIYFYINVHNTEFPKGAIRGQLTR